MITSSKLFSFVDTFKVLDRDDSDHFPISCSIRLEKRAYNNYVISTQYMTTPVTKFKWTSSGQSAFVDNFHSLMSKMYESILDRIISDISGAADMITKFYQQAGKHMLTGASLGSSPLQPHWWNSYCDVLKRQKYQTLRLFRVTDTPLDLRFYKDKRNAFKNYCNHQVINYQNENRTRLLQSRNDPTSFWKK